jgi:hypothetical protein
MGGRGQKWGGPDPDFDKKRGFGDTFGPIFVSRRRPYLGRGGLTTHKITFLQEFTLCNGANIYK